MKFNSDIIGRLREGVWGATYGSGLEVPPLQEEAANTIEAQALDLIRVTEELAKSGSRVITLETWNAQATDEIKRLSAIVNQHEEQWNPISTCPVYEAVLVCGGDVLYPTTMSTTDEPGAGFYLDAQGMLIDDDTWWPEFWKEIPPAKESK